MSAPDDPFSKTAAPPPYASPPRYGQPGAAAPPPYSSPPPYGQPGVPPGLGAPTRSGRAVAALAFAIASYFVIPVVFAVVALVLAPGARREILASHGRLVGDGMVTAAKVLAWINIVAFIAILLVAAAAVASA